MVKAVQGDPGVIRYRHGTHRVMSPKQTLERARPAMPEMGITRIANVTGLDRTGIPVVMACRPNSRSIAVSQGKGLDLDAAKASALMESVETYHAERITLPLKFASFRELSTVHSVIDIDGLPRSLHRPYSPDLRMLWIEGRNWLDQSSLWLPHELASTDYTLPLPPGSGCFAANTNGLASGNHVLEAISHAICEVIERDATTLWKLGSRRNRDSAGLRLDTVDDPACREFFDRVERAEIAVKVWDTTSDVGVPAFYCLLISRQSDGTDPEFGAGCHPVREIALLRALTEAAQARTTYISGARDDFVSQLYSSSSKARRRRDCEALLAAHRETRVFQDIPTRPARTVKENVDWLLARLRSVGIRHVAVIDLTQDRFQLPVVRVVIPGLEGPSDHDHANFVPGARAKEVMPHWS